MCLSYDFTNRVSILQRFKFRLEKTGQNVNGGNPNLYTLYLPYQPVRLSQFTRVWQQRQQTKRGNSKLFGTEEKFKRRRRKMTTMAALQSSFTSLSLSNSFLGQRFSPSCYPPLVFPLIFPLFYFFKHLNFNFLTRAKFLEFQKDLPAIYIIAGFCIILVLS